MRVFQGFYNTELSHLPIYNAKKIKQKAISLHVNFPQYSVVLALITSYTYWKVAIRRSLKNLRISTILQACHPIFLRFLRLSFMGNLKADSQEVYGTPLFSKTVITDTHIWYKVTNMTILLRNNLMPNARTDITTWWCLSLLEILVDNLSVVIARGFPVDSRHSNWNILCPSSSWHLVPLIRRGIHTVFALGRKEAIQFHVQEHRWCFVHKFENYLGQMYPVEL